ncbi:MAG: nucleoside-diphosphate kinase [Actinomycetota bacterium]
MDETLVIVKPDAVRRGLIGEILSRIERKGLRIVEMRTMRIAPRLAEEHYAEHREKPFFTELVEFITSGDVVVARVAGEGAVPVVRELMGPTDPAQAPPGTIRGDFGLLITENLIHGSDSPETAKRELDLFFG